MPQAWPSASYLHHSVHMWLSRSHIWTNELRWERWTLGWPPQASCRFSLPASVTPARASSVVLALCCCHFLLCGVHRKLNVSLFMSMEKMTDLFFFLAHISPFYRQKSRTEELPVGFLSDFALGPQTGHRAHMQWVDPGKLNCTVRRTKKQHISAKS